MPFGCRPRKRFTSPGSASDTLCCCVAQAGRQTAIQFDLSLEGYSLSTKSIVTSSKHDRSPIRCFRTCNSCTTQRPNIHCHLLQMWSFRAGRSTNGCPRSHSRRYSSCTVTDAFSLLAATSFSISDRARFSRSYSVSRCRIGATR